MKLRNLKRICGAHNGCVGCPIKDICYITYYRVPVSEQTLDEIEAECEKWLSDHPPRTRQSEFLTHYPDIRITDYGVIDICPSVMGAEVKGCGDLTCGACKTEYWLAEINEENEK